MYERCPFFATDQPETLHCTENMNNKRGKKGIYALMFDRAIVHIRLSLMIIYFQRAANYAGALMEK